MNSLLHTSSSTSLSSLLLLSFLLSFVFVWMISRIKCCHRLKYCSSLKPWQKLLHPDKNNIQYLKKHCKLSDSSYTLITQTIWTNLFDGSTHLSKHFRLIFFWVRRFRITFFYLTFVVCWYSSSKQTLYNMKDTNYIGKLRLIL